MGTLKLGAVWVLQRKTKAMAGEHPEAHLHSRLVRMLPNALRRPEGRRPNLRAFPLHMTLALLTNLFFIGKSCLHLCLASRPYFICVLMCSVSYWFFFTPVQLFLYKRESLNQQAKYTIKNTDKKPKRALSWSSMIEVEFKSSPNMRKPYGGVATCTAHNVLQCYRWRLWNFAFESWAITGVLFLYHLCFLLHTHTQLSLNTNSSISCYPRPFS